MPFSDLSNWAKKHRLHVWAVETARVLLAVTFLFSALVKANDPVGMSLKLQEYAAAIGWGMPFGLLFLGLAMALAFLEGTLAVALVFGLNRRLTSVAVCSFMTVMTLLTVWIAVADPVKDCGCFGDVIVLTNPQTLAKNIVLLGAAYVLVRWYRLQHRLVASDYSWLVSLPLTVGVLAFAVRNIKSLPFVDFRPYYVGVNLREAREQSPSRPRYDVKIIYQKGNERLELEADDEDPDSSWHYVETRRTPILGQVSETGFSTFLDHRMDVADFDVTDSDGDDLTDIILQDPGYVFLLIAPNLLTADQGCVGNVNLLYDDAVSQGAAFYCLTASDRRAQSYWTDHTGAEYPYAQADGQLLETIVRANPGLVLLHDGVITAKWSNWKIPDHWTRPDRK